MAQLYDAAHVIATTGYYMQCVCILVVSYSFDSLAMLMRSTCSNNVGHTILRSCACTSLHLMFYLKGAYCWYTLLALSLGTCATVMVCVCLSVCYHILVRCLCPHHGVPYRLLKIHCMDLAKNILFERYGIITIFGNSFMHTCVLILASCMTACRQLRQGFCMIVYHLYKINFVLR